MSFCYNICTCFVFLQVISFLLTAYAQTSMRQIFLFHVILIRKMKSSISIRLKAQNKR
ncbi:unnamed protein product [Brassica rapa subsp. trilocularis]